MADFRPPTDEQVKAALRRIVTPALRRAFFEGLKNPLWVTPLFKEGVFSNPPEPEYTSDNLVRETYWPEVDYLARVAQDVPEAVVDVLLKLDKSTNSWVRRAVFSIGSKIPPNQAARLRPLVASWQSTGFGWRSDPRDLVSFAVNLLEGGEVKAGKWFANIIFTPYETNGQTQGDFVLEDYAYLEGFPRVVSALGKDGFSTVLRWLVQFERTCGHFSDQSDISYYSRESIRVHGDSLDNKEQILIDALRDLAVDSILSDSQNTFNALLKSQMLLSRKILMYALAAAIEMIDDDDPRLPTLAKLASDLLFDEESSDDSCRIDYAELARAVAAKSPSTLDPLVQFIEPGPRVDKSRLREWMSRDEEDEDVLDGRVQEYVDHWKHRWLSAIGSEAIPALLQTDLATLDARYGVIDNPLAPTKVITSWTGPNSPITQVEMTAMSPSELVAHLESWHYSGPGIGPEPSHEGQARVLAALIASDPSAIIGVDNLVGRLRPTYLRAILQGWETALRNGIELEWSEVIDLTSQVLSHSNESTFDSEGGTWDDDSNFRWTKQAAVSLLQETVKKHDNLTIPVEAMNQLAEMLIMSASDEIAWTEYISQADETSDPLNISLNWQWPIRLRGLVQLMTLGVDTPWYQSAESALDSELSRDDIRVASRAVIGESLGRLINSNPDWVNKRAQEIFGTETGLSVGQQVALTTAMATHYYHQSLYELFTPSMIGAMKTEGSIRAGWRSDSDPLQRIGEWAISAIMFGHRTMDDPVATAFFESAPARVRGGALGRIAWQFMHASSVDESIRGRLATLWDQRVEHVRATPNDKDELNQFFWFVKSKKFPVEWWLPRLKEAIELSPGATKERYFIATELATSADLDPRTAFEVLRLLIEGSDEPGPATYDLSHNAVPFVLARAINSGDDELRTEAETFMNQLGELGDLSLERKVRDVIEGKISQDDAGD